MNEVKLLQVYDYLQKNSSPAHHVTLGELEEICGIRDRRTVYNLCNFIAQVRPDLEKVSRPGRENEYYFTGSALEYAEALSFVLSLQSCISICPKITKNLIGRLADVTGGEVRDRLKSALPDLNSVKHSNRKTVYVINEVEEAIRTRKKIRFKYFHFNPDGTETASHDGAFYVLDPITVAADHDRWYLFCYDPSLHPDAEPEKNIRTFRVDRIKKVSVVHKKDIAPEAPALKKQVEEDMKLSFKAWRGDAAEVTLKFHPSHVGRIFDKFGEKTPVEQLDDETCRTTVRVGVSDQFFAWVVGSGGKMTVEAPKEIRKQYKEFLKRVTKEI